MKLVLNLFLCVVFSSALVAEITHNHANTSSPSYQDYCTLCTIHSGIKKVFHTPKANLFSRLTFESQNLCLCFSKRTPLNFTASFYKAGRAPPFNHFI